MSKFNLGAASGFPEAASSLREALTDRAATDDPNGMGPVMRPTYDVQAAPASGFADYHDRDPIRILDGGAAPTVVNILAALELA